MFIFDDIIQYFTVQKTLANIKRYIIGAKLVFGKTYTVPIVKVSIKAPMPPGGRLQVFNSHTEAGGGLNADGSVEYIDVVRNPVLSNIILEGPLLKALMETNDNPYAYFYKYPSASYPVSIIWGGKRKYFRYNINMGLLALDYTENYSTFQRMKDAAALENACNAFVEAAQRNAKALALVAKNFNSYDAATQQRIRLAVINHNNTINAFKTAMPAGFYVQTNTINPAQFTSNDGIGVIPVIIWVVIVITAGVVVTAVAVNYLRNKADVDKQRNALDSQYNTIQQLQSAAEALNQGRITQGQYNDIRTAANQVIKTNSDNLTRAAEADARDKESGGMLGQVKQILVVGGIIIVAKEIFKLIGNGKKK